MQKADTLIRTKLHLPFTRPGLVSRPRLQEQIKQGLCCPLTLVTAPAGFGKTTLVAEFVAGLSILARKDRSSRLQVDSSPLQPATLNSPWPASSQEPITVVAWLSLDKNDNQPGRFLGYLIATLQEVDHTIGSEAARLLATSQQAPTEIILINLINDLDATGRDIVLVLDD